MSAEKKGPQVIIVTKEKNETVQKELEAKIGAILGAGENDVSIHQVGEHPSAGRDEGVLYLREKVRKAALESGPVTVVALPGAGVTAALVHGAIPVVRNLVIIDSPVRLDSTSLPLGARNNIINIITSGEATLTGASNVLQLLGEVPDGNPQVAGLRAAVHNGVVRAFPSRRSVEQGSS